MNPLAAFWDSSALVPLCLREPATRSAEQSFHKYPPVIWWTAAVEIYSAIARSLRSGTIDSQEAERAMDSLGRIRMMWREILPAYSVRNEACRLLDVYPLRAADALQLAAALVWCQQRPAGRVFVCSDRRLSAAARAAGFSVVEL